MSGPIRWGSIRTMALAPSNTRWGYTPPLPLQPAPLVRRPFRPRAIAIGLVSAWRPLSSRVVILAVSVVVWLWFSPTTAEAATIEAGWVAEVWVRNLVVVLASAGLTHLWLYRWRRQGDSLRYDTRPLARKRLFLFGDQVKDNMFLTLTFGVAVWTAWEVFMWWAYANGVAPRLEVGGSMSGVVWFTALLLIIPIYSNNHFAVGHWLLHRGPAYRHIHSVHHKNVNVGPWSGLAMHPLEHVLLFADVWLFLLVPSSPFHMLFAMMHHGVGAPLSHTGYDAIELGRGRTGSPLRLAVGDFHHQLHHRFIECNYGGMESPLDDWLDSFHDGTAGGDRHIADRRRRLAAARRS